MITYVSECSAIFFNLAWLLRTTPLKESIFVKLFECSFAIAFFVLRCFNLPIATMGVLILIEEENKAAKYLLLPIATLQFYWMYLIIKSIISKFFGKDHEHERNTKSSTVVKKNE